MQLIYLYIENYKNIKNQGFNFTTQFKCDYKDGTLTIDKNENYMEKFFGDNIEVSAIVGENGSGKSSIIKMFFMLIYYKIYGDGEESENYINLIRQKHKKSFFAVIRLKNGNYKVISYNIDISEYDELSKEELNFFSIYFNYIADSWVDDYEDYWINNLYHKTDNYKTPILLQPNKFNKNTQSNYIDIDMISELTTKRTLQFYAYLENTTSITSFFKPNYIKLNDLISTTSYSAIGNYVEFVIIQKIATHLLKVNEKYHYKFNYEGDNKLLKELKAIEEKKDYKYLNQLYISLKLLLSSKNIFNDEIYKRIEDSYKDMIESDTLMSVENTVQETEFTDLFKESYSEYEVLKIKNCIEFQEQKIYDNPHFLKLVSGDRLYLEDAQTKKILNFIPPWLNIDFFEEDKSLASLSSGEKALFSIITNVMYQLRNINGESYDTINIFFDETELGLHPKWQREYLVNIVNSIKALNNKNKTIMLFFSTHSPFILSDIPRQNIVFLKDGKQVDALEKKQTFGANIHTLLADSFFMDGGLMGEFAKEKIEEVIKFLNDDSSKIQDKNEAQKIINIIGEPILKNQLQKMLDSKRLDKIDKIDELEDEIEQLKYRIEILRKNQ